MEKYNTHLQNYKAPKSKYLQSFCCVGELLKLKHLLFNIQRNTMQVILNHRSFQSSYLINTTKNKTKLQQRKQIINCELLQFLLY